MINKDGLYIIWVSNDLIQGMLGDVRGFFKEHDIIIIESKEDVFKNYKEYLCINIHSKNNPPCYNIQLTNKKDSEGLYKLGLLEVKK